MQTGLSAAAADVAIVMGPSGFPVPAPLYVMAAMEQYVQQFAPGALPLPLTTPEGLFPITGINTLPLDSSVKIGVTTLNNAIMQQIAAGNHVDVFGYSQSSLISSSRCRSWLRITFRPATFRSFCWVIPQIPTGVSSPD